MADPLARHGRQPPRRAGQLIVATIATALVVALVSTGSVGAFAA
ncbi:MAG TPA: hypothetical protein VNT53_01660 [Pseudolysinimonas sp.]|nr:hypothetical protein [Pseudolysinimonas sp.]